MDDPDMKYDLDPADLDQGEETKDRRRKFREDEDRALARIHINNNTPATLKAQIQRARNRLSAQRHRQRQKAGIVDLQHEVDREKQRRIAAEAHVHHLQRAHEDLRRQFDMAKMHATELEARIRACYPRSLINNSNLASVILRKDANNQNSGASLPAPSVSPLMPPSGGFQ